MPQLSGPSSSSTSTSAAGAEVEAALRRLCRQAREAAQDVATAYAAAAAAAARLPAGGCTPAQEQHAYTNLARCMDSVDRLLASVQHATCDALAAIFAAATATDGSGPGCSAGGRSGGGGSRAAWVAAFFGVTGVAVDLLEACLAARLHEVAMLAAALKGSGSGGEPGHDVLEELEAPCMFLRVLRRLYQLAADVVRHGGNFAAMENTAKGSAGSRAGRAPTSPVQDLIGRTTPMIAQMVHCREPGLRDVVGSFESTLCRALVQLRLLLAVNSAGPTVTPAATSAAAASGDDGSGSGSSGGRRASDYSGGVMVDEVGPIAVEYCLQLVGLRWDLPLLQTSAASQKAPATTMMFAALAVGGGRLGLLTADLLAALLDLERRQAGQQQQQQRRLGAVITASSRGGGGSGSSAGPPPVGAQAAVGLLCGGPLQRAPPTACSLAAGSAAGLELLGPPAAGQWWCPGFPAWVLELRRWLPSIDLDSALAGIAMQWAGPLLRPDMLQRDEQAPLQQRPAWRLPSHLGTHRLVLWVCNHILQRGWEVRRADDADGGSGGLVTVEVLRWGLVGLSATASLELMWPSGAAATAAGPGQEPRSGGQQQQQQGLWQECSAHLALALGCMFLELPRRDGSSGDLTLEGQDPVILEIRSASMEIIGHITTCAGARVGSLQVGWGASGGDGEGAAGPPVLEPGLVALHVRTMARTLEAAAELADDFKIQHSGGSSGGGGAGGGGGASRGSSSGRRGSSAGTEPRDGGSDGGRGGGAQGRSSEGGMQGGAAPRPPWGSFESNRAVYRDMTSNHIPRAMGDLELAASLAPGVLRDEWPRMVAAAAFGARASLLSCLETGRWLASRGRGWQERDAGCVGQVQSMCRVLMQLLRLCRRPPPVPRAGWGVPLPRGPAEPCRAAWLAAPPPPMAAAAAAVETVAAVDLDLASALLAWSRPAKSTSGRCGQGCGASLPLPPSPRLRRWQQDEQPPPTPGSWAGGRLRPCSGAAVPGPSRRAVGGTAAGRADFAPAAQDHGGVVWGMVPGTLSPWQFFLTGQLSITFEIMARAVAAAPAATDGTAAAAGSKPAGPGGTTLPGGSSLVQESCFQLLASIRMCADAAGCVWEGGAGGPGDGSSQPRGGRQCALWGDEWDQGSLSAIESPLETISKLVQGVVVAASGGDGGGYVAELGAAGAGAALLQLQRAAERVVVVGEGGVDWAQAAGAAMADGRGSARHWVVCRYAWVQVGVAVGAAWLAVRGLLPGPGQLRRADAVAAAAVQAGRHIEGGWALAEEDSPFVGRPGEREMGPHQALVAAAAAHVHALNIAAAEGGLPAAGGGGGGGGGAGDGDGAEPCLAEAAEALRRALRVEEALQQLAQMHAWAMWASSVLRLMTVLPGPAQARAAQMFGQPPQPPGNGEGGGGGGVLATLLHEPSEGGQVLVLRPSPGSESAHAAAPPAAAAPTAPPAASPAAAASLSAATSGARRGGAGGSGAVAAAAASAPSAPTWPGRAARYIALHPCVSSYGCGAVACLGVGLSRGSGANGGGTGANGGGLCGGCGAVRYCSAACQRRDYRWHAPTCREMRERAGRNC